MSLSPPENILVENQKVSCMKVSHFGRLLQSKSVNSVGKMLQFLGQSPQTSIGTVREPHLGIPQDSAL